nr:6-phosphogluconolactonase [Veillonella rogosae]
MLELLNSPPEYIERLNWERIFFVWTDERFLPQTHEDNYFNRVKPPHLLCKAKGGRLISCQSIRILEPL